MQNFMQSKSRAGTEAVEAILQELHPEHDAVLSVGMIH